MMTLRSSFGSFGQQLHAQLFLDLRALPFELGQLLARQLGQLTVGTLPGDRPGFFLLADHVPVTPGKRRQPFRAACSWASFRMRT